MNEEDDDPASGSTDSTNTLAKIITADIFADSLEQKIFDGPADSPIKDAKSELLDIPINCENNEINSLISNIHTESLDYSNNVVEQQYSTYQSDDQFSSDDPYQELAKTAMGYIHGILKPVNEVYRFIEGVVEESREKISYAGELMIKSLDFWRMGPSASGGAVSLAREIYLSLHLQEYKITS
ncbi:hypothetical protein K9M79_02125 [Candidatus Woesearchaeota archaeon]|nr:hypothetical protein [Candidatus Woesearchaeota archaeon]